MRTTFLIILFCFFTFNLICQSGGYSPATNYGSKSELKRFIEQELFIPQKFLEQKINDELILCFVVTENGEIRELKLSKSIDPKIDKIALEIFDRLLWAPAIYNSRAVNTKECITIKFSYKKYPKYVKKRGYDFPEYKYVPMDSTNIIYALQELDSAPKPIFENQMIDIGTFIKNEIQYPELAYSNNITGTVKISFVVEQSGRMSNIKVSNNLGGGCDSEALRLLKLLNWEPGYKDGMAIRTKLTFKINFNLMEGADINYVPAGTLGGVY